MARPPQRRDERLIDARMWRDVAEIGLVSALLTLLSIDHYLPGGLLAGDQSLGAPPGRRHNVVRPPRGMSQVAKQH